MEGVAYPGEDGWADGLAGASLDVADVAVADVGGVGEFALAETLELPLESDGDAVDRHHGGFGGFGFGHDNNVLLCTGLVNNVQYVNDQSCRATRLNNAVQAR
jgi:hypothetical protein